MRAYILRRFLVSLGVLFGVTVAVFGLLQLAPGDAASVMIDPLRFSGDREAALAALREQLGLDQPVYVQYFRWLGSVLTGQLGFSTSANLSVTQLLANRAPATLMIIIPGLLLGATLGIVIGAAAALRKGKFADHFATAYAMVMTSIPAFFIALVGIFFLGVQLNVVATGGMTSGYGGVNDFLRHITLPVLVIAIVVAAPYSRYARASILGVLDQDFLVAARARGLRGPTIVRRHVARNALIPIISFTALELPALIGGTVIIEQVFAWPGLGRMAIDAIYARDYAVILAFTMIVAVVVLLSNFLADVLYAVADPRIRIDR